MTTRGKLEEMLVEMGMFEEQAVEVLDLAIPKMDEIAADYDITWNSPADGYPQVMYNMWFSSVKKVAKEWIAKNKPQAWYRPMFE